MIDFNAPPGGPRGPDRPFYDQDALSDALKACAERWVPEIFKAGIIDKRKGELRCADISGAKPRKQGSCVIQLRGEKAGSYYDHGIEKGGGPLATIGDHFGLVEEELFAKAAAIVEQYGNGINSNVVPLPARGVSAARKLAEAQFELSRARPPAGTLAEVYFKSRGLALPAAPDLLFGAEATYHPSGGQPTAEPALIARVRFPNGQPTGGIHRTFLKRDGSGHLEKMCLGPCEGGIIMLAQPNGSGELGIAEGIESAIAATQLTGLPCWAGISTGHMRHLANIIRQPGAGLPGVSRLYIFTDRGRDGETTAETLRACARAGGLQAQVILPRGDDDFADDLARGLPSPDLTMEQPPTAEALMTQARALGRNPELVDLKALFLAIAATPLDTLAIERLLDTIRGQTKMKPTALTKCLKEARAEIGLDGGVSKPAGPQWTNKLRTSDSGSPKAVIANAVTAFREAPEWCDILLFDEFTNRVVIRGQAPWMKSATEVQWQDHFDVETATWLQQRDIDVTPTMVAQAADLAARDHSFHPVRDYLESLHWDGKPRLDRWLTYYLGAEPIIEADDELAEAQRLFVSQSAYLSAVGRAWMISAVARIFRPGCKADCALILEGPQGKRKSMAIQKLAVSWFADEISEFGGKEAAILIAGVWIVELAELSALHRSDIERAKSFMSRNTDHYRPVWGRRWIDQPRQCVFAGTTNSNEYLNDPTGARRWWPVKCGKIDIDALEDDRDQLWAEAVAAYRADEIWWLEGETLIATARKEQAARSRTDVWDERISKFLSEQTIKASANNRDIFLTRADVLRELGIPDKDQTQIHANRIADCFVRFGWERFQIRKDALRGTWAYRPKKVDNNDN